MKSIIRALALGATTSLVIPLTAATARAEETAKTGSPVVVVSGLNNPRELSLVKGTTLLIAEAGKGGDLATIPSPEGGPQGLGQTGSISVVSDARHASGQTPNRIVTGLLSAATTGGPEGPAGSGATGSDGVSANSLRKILIAETVFPPDVVPAADASNNGALLRASANGTAHPVANIAAFETTHDPDEQGVDTNPYAVLQVGDEELVADAAGNTVLKVDEHGHVSLFHVFPNIVNATCTAPAQQQPPPAKPGCQFVPTSLARDRSGNIYVGGLGGLVPDQGRVVKLSSDGKTVLRTWTGFTAVTGVAVDHHGDLYVSQLFAPEQNPVNPMVQGVVTEVRGNSRENVDVPFPAGIVVDALDNVFVSAFSIAPDSGFGVPGLDTSGQVWRLRI